MKKQQLNKKTEVYNISGFKDTLASPIFYPVIVVAMVLGVTSIFGFVQNPLKLKTYVNVIQQKVATRNVVNESFEDSFYDVSNQDQFRLTSRPTKTIESFELFTESNFNNVDEQKMPVNNSIERIAFNYDVTSENFWSELDSSNLETATEEMKRKEKEAAMIGAPLKIDHLYDNPTEFNINDKSIYALNKSKI